MSPLTESSQRSLHKVNGIILTTRLIELQEGLGELSLWLVQLKGLCKSLWTIFISLLFSLVQNLDRQRIQKSTLLSLIAATVVAVSISNIPVTAGIGNPFKRCLVLNCLFTNDQMRWTRK